MSYYTRCFIRYLLALLGIFAAFDPCSITKNGLAWARLDSDCETSLLGPSHGDEVESKFLALDRKSVV